MSEHPLGVSRFVLTEGRWLHYRVAGSGGVTVVFESGLGLSGVCWGLVQPAVARLARTVVYDRAGAGLSDDDRSPRTLSRLAADLGVVLREVGGPLILVGHSWGGPIVRLAATTAGADIRGLVLVDPTDENDTSFFLPAAARRYALAAPLTHLLTLTGLYARSARIGRALPPALYAQFRDENFRRRAARLLAAEIRHFLPGLRALRDHPPHAPDMPVTIISAGAGDLCAAHRISAVSRPNGRHVELAGAGHNIMFDRPAAVVDEIARMLAPNTRVSPPLAASAG